jgi:hypothetical protein
MQQFLAMCSSTPWESMGMKDTMEIIAPRINEFILLFEDRADDCDGVETF